MGGRMGGGCWRSRHADAVAERLQDSDPSVRSSAALALTAMGEDGCRHSSAVAALLRDGTEMARLAAAQALGALADPRGASQAVVYLHDASPEVRLAAAAAFGYMRQGGVPYAPEVASLLKDGSPEVCRVAEWALASIGVCAVPQLLELLTHAEEHTRFSAARAL